MNKPRKPKRIRKTKAKPISPRKRTTQSRSPSPPKSVFSLKIEEIEKQLASGEVNAELELYFGPQLPELQQLARSAASSRGPAAARPKALVLPGIMGSTLGFKRPILSIFNDTVWVDPIDIAIGRLKLLAIPSTKKIIALDPFPLIYVGLKLALQAAGFNADYFPFDWRLNLRELGAALKAKLTSLGPGKVHLAAHSMGGLVARAALKQGASNIGSVVMMGTPNFGSYSPVLALRGVHDLASKISGLDFTQSNVELTEHVFATFPGLTQMLPLGPIANGIDWHDSAFWPASPRVIDAVLDEGATVTSLLAPAPADWTLIAGVDQETIVRAEKDSNGGGFRYQRSFVGDGTVPLASARLAELKDAQVFFVKHGHGTLPMNSSVKQAVIQLFKKEPVTALSNEIPPVRPAPTEWLTDDQMRSRSAAAARVRSAPGASRIGEAAARLRSVLDAPLGSPSVLPVASAPPSTVPEATPLSGFVVSREKQFYLEIELVQGDIAQIESEAIVLAQFQNMDLGRAAQSVDAQMDGVLADMVQRRMFSANVGELFVLPTGRHPVRIDIVAIVGLGAVDGLLRSSGDLSWETLELVAENTMRTLLGAGVSEFATVLFGNLSEAGPAVLRQGVAHFMQGFLRGLADARDRRRFRRVTLCESDPVRFAGLRQALLDMLPTPLFETVQVRLDERTLPAPPILEHRTISAAAAGDLGRDPNYLFIRVNRVSDSWLFDTTFVPAHGRAATPREVQRVSKDELESILKPIKPTSWDDTVSANEVRQSGKLIASLLLHPTHRELLIAELETPLIIVHDEEASRIPWETLRLGDNGDYLPAIGPGISRQYAAANLSVAKWVEARRRDEKLRILLVVDPLGDLDGARREGGRIRELFKEDRAVVLTEVRQDEATRSRLLDHFRSGQFDVVHYAGHAFFDPAAPERSGLICAPRDEQNPSVLSGADVAGLGQLPMLVFFNACESARVRGLKKKTGAKSNHPDRMRGLVSVAEAMMRGGVANFLGTYWPVGDDAALQFATTLYKGLLEGQPLGPAVTRARQKVQETSADWADYIHYGSPNFILKTRNT
jgi:CHAT domain-containing protein/pimeloyl-ACP methyl ester carboxylesterase